MKNNFPFTDKDKLIKAAATMIQVVILLLLYITTVIHNPTFAQSYSVSDRNEIPVLIEQIHSKGSIAIAFKAIEYFVCLLYMNVQVT